MPEVSLYTIYLKYRYSLWLPQALDNDQYCKIAPIKIPPQVTYDFIPRPPELCHFHATYTMAFIIENPPSILY